MERLDNQVLENAISVYRTVSEITEDMTDHDYNPALDKVTLLLLEELKAYRDAEEQGLLIRLPCKLGDVIYYVEDGYIYKFIADRIEINNGIDDCDYCIDNMNFKKSDFGEIAFLSLEEAEAALAEMEK